MMSQQLLEREPSSPVAPQPAVPVAERPAHWGRRILMVVVLITLGLGGGLASTMASRVGHERRLDTAARETAAKPPVVSIVKARQAPKTSELNLPGNALPFREAALYARTTGYLKGWTVDIGDRVKEGQVLAEISAPDVDDQYAQAKANLMLSRANLKVSEANLALAKIALTRDIASGKAVSEETVDQDRAQVKTTEAQVGSATANIEVNEATVKQFADLVNFQKIVAPFPGVITVRNVDPGALVTADNPSETRELFHLMQTNPLRVFINVPQVNATTIAVGQEATIFRTEAPHRLFKGKVSRTANALDPNTRTLLTQVDVPNPHNELRPGMYLRVNFVGVRSEPPVIIPSAALVTRSEGMLVGVLDESNTVHYRKVQLGRDFGPEIEIVDGVKAGDSVIVHPGDTLPEGLKAEPATLSDSRP